MNDMSQKMVVGQYVLSDDLARCRPYTEDAFQYCNIIFSAAPAATLAITRMHG